MVVRCTISVVRHVSVVDDAVCVELSDLCGISKRRSEHKGDHNKAEVTSAGSKGVKKALNKAVGDGARGRESEMSSARGSEERAGAASFGGRGPRRGRDYELENVSGSSGSHFSSLNFFPSPFPLCPKQFARVA